MQSQRGKQTVFIEKIGLISQRNMRQRAGAFETDHAGADSPHRVRHLVYKFPGISAGIIPPAVRDACFLRRCLFSR